MVTFQWRIVATNPRMRVRPSTFTITNTGVRSLDDATTAGYTDDSDVATTDIVTPTLADDNTTSLYYNVTLGNETVTDDYYDYYNNALDFPDDYLAPTVYFFDWNRYTVVNRRDGSLTVDYDEDVVDWLTSHGNKQTPSDCYLRPVLTSTLPTPTVGERTRF